MYVRGKRLQKGSTHSSSALQQRRTDGRRHTRETTQIQRRALVTTPEGAGRAGVTNHSSSALQRRTDGRRHTRETTEAGACDYCNTGRGWKGRRKEKGGKIVAYFFLFFSLLGQPGGVEEGGRTACGREISYWVGYPGGSSSGCLTS